MTEIVGIFLLVVSFTVVGILAGIELESRRSRNWLERVNRPKTKGTV